jgi:ABC-type branched-subunit amino acid transport system substrate-binding protein
MMPPNTLRRGPAGRRATAVAIAAAAVLAGTVACSSKTTGSETNTTAGGSASAKPVSTGVGITGNVIHLGALTDITGVFAASGKDVTLGQQIYWKLENAKGGVCDRFTVDLKIEDHGYNVQKATAKYAGLKDGVLSLTQLLGSPMATALAPDVKKDQMMAMPVSWARTIADNPYYAIVGPTYDVEIINGLDYLLAQGKIAKGAKIGHIFHDSEYGANALTGVKFFAERNGMTVVEQKISALEPDLSSRVTALKAAGVNVIVLTTQPLQTAAAASAAAAQQLNVPILGSGPTFLPALLDTPARDVLVGRYYQVGPNAGLDSEAAKPLLDAYLKENPGGKAGNPLVTGYAIAQVMDTILEKACADGDLTRPGVFAAKQTLTAIDTGGLTGPLDYSKPGISPSKQNFVTRPELGRPGGSATVAALYQGPTATAFTQG